MNKKGFTLIELIGTIVILSLALVLIIPTVTNSIKKSVEDADASTKKSIEAAARNYVSDNRSVSCVNIETLIENGYLNDDLKRPSNKENITGSVRIDKKQNSAGKIKYTLKYQEEAC